MIDGVAICCRHQCAATAVSPEPSPSRSHRSRFRRLVARDIELCFAPQNMGEFWNVSTRPVERNGLGLSIEDTNAQISAMERRMSLLQEDGQVYTIWRRLLLTHNVRGVQVHDAHLAAILEVHSVTHLLTFNGQDFKRFTTVVPVHPKDVEP